MIFASSWLLLTTLSLLDMCQSPIGPFFSIWLVTIPEVLTPCSFLFVSKVISVQVGHVAVTWKLKANQFATQTGKTGKEWITIVQRNESEMTLQAVPTLLVQAPASRSWTISLHLITFQPTSWCLGVCPWSTSSPKTSLGSPTHPSP